MKNLRNCHIFKMKFPFKITPCPEWVPKICKCMSSVSKYHFNKGGIYFTLCTDILQLFFHFCHLLITILKYTLLFYWYFDTQLDYICQLFVQALQHGLFWMEIHFWNMTISPIKRPANPCYRDRAYTRQIYLFGNRYKGEEWDILYRWHL